MNDDEKILVEAVLEKAISGCAFRAVLDNGHSFVAWVKKACMAEAHVLCPGRRVRVCFSPFDMSEGQIVLEQ